MVTKTIQDADALLLYRVGPVYCCSPTMPVISVQLPPRLSHPPGSNTSQPGVFRFASGIVRVVDLRQCFGVDEEDRERPGKIVVTEVSGGLAGFWVDEIIDVIQFPQQGWGSVPALVPRNIFTRTLLFNDHIQLYAELESFNNFRETGYLRSHIQALKSQFKARESTLPSDSTAVVLRTRELEAQVEPPATNPVSLDQALAGKEAAALPPVDEADSSKSHSGIELGSSVLRPSVPTSPSSRTVEKSSAVVHSQAATVKPVRTSPPVQMLQAGKTAMKATSPSVKSQLPVTGNQLPVRGPAIPENNRSPRFDTQREQPVSERLADVRQDKTDYGLWLLSGFLLLAIIAGVYFLTNMTGLNPVYSEHVTLQAENTEIDEPVSIEPDVPILQQQPESVEQVAREPASKMSVIDTDRVDDTRSPVVAEIPDPENVSSQQAYRATINEDEEGLVIVLEAPDEELLAGTASTFDNEQPAITSSVLPSKQLDEKVAAVETDNNSNGQVVADTANKTGKKVISTTMIHVVVQGDTLWHIAQRYIHNPWRYPELARLSKIKNPDLIYPGDRVKIIINKKSRSDKK